MGRNPRHLGDPDAAAQADGRPRVLVSRCLLGDRVRYDGRDKYQPTLTPLLSRWRLLPVCPELEAGLGVPRPPMDLVGPRGATRPIERASGRDLTAEMQSTVDRLIADIRGGGLDGAILKARSPSCGPGSAGRYERVDDPAPAERVDGLFAAAIRGLSPPPRLADEALLRDGTARRRFALAVDLRAALRGATDGDALARLWAVSPLGDALTGLGLQRDAVFDLKDDRSTLVGHIDRAVDRFPATNIAGVHQTIGSYFAK